MSRLTVTRIVFWAVLAAGTGVCAQGTTEQPQYGGTAVAALGSDPGALNPNITVGVWLGYDDKYFYIGLRCLEGGHRGFSLA